MVAVANGLAKYAPHLTGGISGDLFRLTHFSGYAVQRVSPSKESIAAPSWCLEYSVLTDF